MNEELQLAPLERTEIERYADVAPVISIEQAIARHRLLSEYVKQVMREHHDYGAIPGTSGKPSLLKPGAEKLTTLFGLTKRLFIVEKMEDWVGQIDGELFFYYICESGVENQEKVGKSQLPKAMHQKGIF